MLLRRCCEEAGAPSSKLRGGRHGSSELRGLRSDDTRPSDITWLDFFGPSGKHLLIDTTVATLYRKYMLASGRFNTPGLAAREAENEKFKKDGASSLPTTLGPHRLVPFAIEESGRFGRHAIALLRELASRGVTDGFLKPPSSWLSAKRPQIISYWVE